MNRLEATNLLREVLQAKFGIDARGIRAIDTLASLGVDSLSGLEVLFDVEERLGVQLPAELISPDCTLTDLAERLESYTGDGKMVA